MKKSIVFGMLAMFAVSAMSIQTVNAQNEDDPKNAQSVSVKNDTKNPLNKEAISVPEKPANEAINSAKPKQQADSEISPIKGGETPNPKGQDQGKIQAQTKKIEPKVNDSQKPAVVKEGEAKGEEPTMRNAQNDNSGNGKLQAERKIKTHDATKDEPQVKDAQKPATVKEGKASAEEPTMRNAQNNNHGNGSLQVEKKHKNLQPETQAKPSKKKMMKKSTTMKKETNSKVVDKDGKVQDENATRPKEKIGTGTAQENNEGVR